MCRQQRVLQCKVGFEEKNHNEMTSLRAKCHKCSEAHPKNYSFLRMQACGLHWISFIHVPSCCAGRRSSIMISQTVIANRGRIFSSMWRLQVRNPTKHLCLLAWSESRRRCKEPGVCDRCGFARGCAQMSSDVCPTLTLILQKVHDNEGTHIICTGWYGLNID